MTCARPPLLQRGSNLQEAVWLHFIPYLRTVVLPCIVHLGKRGTVHRRFAGDRSASRLQGAPKNPRFLQASGIQAAVPPRPALNPIFPFCSHGPWAMLVLALLGAGDSTNTSQLQRCLDHLTLCTKRGHRDATPRHVTDSLDPRAVHCSLCCDAPLVTKQPPRAVPKSRSTVLQLSPQTTIHAGCFGRCICWYTLLTRGLD